MQSSENVPPALPAGAHPTASAPAGSTDPAASPMSDGEPGRRVRAPRRSASKFSRHEVQGLPENMPPVNDAAPNKVESNRPKLGGLTERKLEEFRESLSSTFDTPLSKPKPLTDAEREAILLEHLVRPKHGRRSRAATDAHPETGLNLGTYGIAGSLTNPLRTLIIGAGQAGLVSAYNLMQRDMWPYQDFMVVDANALPGGAWQHRPQHLNLANTHAIHDLPGLTLAEALTTAERDENRPTAAVVRDYFGTYERRFDLPVVRPFEVSAIDTVPDSPLLRITGKVRSTGSPPRGGDTVTLYCESIINATGTWTSPFIPHYPGMNEFGGAQIHSKQFTDPQNFAGQRVAIIGGGNSAVQTLLALHNVATTTWFTRRRPVVNETRLTTELGHQVEVAVGEAVARGELPGSVVSYTGLGYTPVYDAAAAAGLLVAHPMFTRLDATGAVVATDTGELHIEFDAIIWCTGYRPAIRHLMPLKIRTPQGGLPMTGNLKTQVAGDNRIHLVGYGPSASTSGAFRAGRIAARDVAKLFPPQHLNTPSADGV